MWFVEDPWPPVMVLGVALVVFGIAWFATRRGLYFLGAAGSVVLVLAAFVVDELVETEGEKVEVRVLALRDDVVKGDIEKVLSYISNESRQLKSIVGSQLEDVDIEEGLRITDLSVAMQPDGKRAVSHFRANGRGTYQKSWTGQFTTRWHLTWQKDGKAWMLVKIEQLELYEDEVINTWPAQ